MISTWMYVSCLLHRNVESAYVLHAPDISVTTSWPSEVTTSVWCFLGWA